MPTNATNNRKTKKPARAGGRFPPNPHAATIYKAPSFAPARTRRTLRYCQELSLTGTSGAIGFNGFGLNCAFDPDTTGGGHQPLGWDQYMAMYSRCCVTATRITAEFVLSGVTVPTIVAITGTPGTTTWSAATGRIESGLTSYRVLPATNSVPCTLTSSFDLKAFSGNDDLLDEPDVWCTASANPATIFGAQVWVRDLNGTSTVNVQVLVNIEFDCVFLQPAYVAQS